MNISLSSEDMENLTKYDLAKLIFRLGKKGFGSAPGLLEKLCPENKASDPVKEHQNRAFTEKFYEAIAWMKHQGLLMDVLDHIGSPTDYHKHHIPDIRPTSAWESSHLDDDGNIILIDDAQKIVTSLKEEIKELDPVVEQYYLESIRACQDCLYISSVICLGAASEKAIHCLADAIIVYDCKYEEGIRKNRKEISKLIQHVSANVADISEPVFSKGFMNELKEELDGIAFIYRRNRNKAGHPREIQSVGRAQQESFLYAFDGYARTIFKAIDMLKSAP